MASGTSVSLDLKIDGSSPICEFVCMCPEDWPSLSNQIALAKRLFGEEGSCLLTTWLKEQFKKTTDPDFARSFKQHYDQLGIAPGDFNHRHILRGKGSLLGGIRFYGGDIHRPFVDIVAHDFADWNWLRECVAEEWAAFAPLDLRVLVTQEIPLPTDARVDISIFAAQYRVMHAPDGRVSLSPFQDLKEVISMVAEKYADIAQADPRLAHNISATDDAYLEHLYKNDQIRAIRAVVEGTERTVGLLAVAPEAVEWIKGDVVIEEVVLSAYNGHGFAASAQREWAARPDRDPNSLLIGTIDGLNFSSRRTATKAGREAILDFVFLPLN